MPSVPPEPLGLPVTQGACVLGLRPDVKLGAGIPLAMETLHSSWSPVGLGVVSPRPCTMRFDMVNTAVTKTRKYKARSSWPAANKASTSAGPSRVGSSVGFRA